MMILYCGLASYLVTGMALGAARLSPSPPISIPGLIRGLSTSVSPSGGEKEEAKPPSYAQLCDEIRNPMSLGHQLGPLFRHDGAIKAGCGTEPFNVAGSGTWVSQGMCDGEIRSLAVSAAGYDPAIAYGSPARFAWAAAQAGTLVALEVAEPNEGDVYLVVTLNGTYGFARPTRTLREGPAHPQSCSEVGGQARPFAKLEPVMVNLWLELMQQRAEWSWPKPQNSDPQNLTFTDRFDATDVAEGRCDYPESCWIRTGEETWPLEGSGFVSMEELAPYMPS